MENITLLTNTKKIETPQKNKHISEKLPSLAPRLGKRSGKESSLSHDLPSSSCNDSYNHTTFGFSVTDPIIAAFLRHNYAFIKIYEFLSDQECVHKLSSNT
ncbi:hypothetical protein pdam_00009944 [Pocillopora damicornis]|uniref:Uncharacterized protein n=1 Tax=Pocillopora damicornis TaxID=46731 RepID=A0A3M6UTC5_POCDA|nr:hypothetical protein pdam_00009944 [Pocillopora damicornis]